MESILSIFITQKKRIKLGDFGIAHIANLDQNAFTQLSAQIGTLPYMSPEQIQGEKLSVASDMYAVGVVFYEMLTGKKPYTGLDAMSIILKHTKSPIPMLPHRLSQHQVLINLLLAKRRADRIQSAEEILEWL